MATLGSHTSIVDGATLEELRCSELIIDSLATPSELRKRSTRAESPGLLAGWRAIPAAVHARSGKIFLQIFHTGRIALPDFLPDHAQPVAPSAPFNDFTDYPTLAPAGETGR